MNKTSHRWSSVVDCPWASSTEHLGNSRFGSPCSRCRQSELYDSSYLVFTLPYVFLVVLYLVHVPFFLSRKHAWLFYRNSEITGGSSSIADVLLFPLNSYSIHGLVLMHVVTRHRMMFCPFHYDLKRFVLLLECAGTLISNFDDIAYVWINNDKFSLIFC